MTARLFTLNPVEGFRPKTFAGHKDAVLGAYFSSDGTTVSKNENIWLFPNVVPLDLHDKS